MKFFVLTSALVAIGLSLPAQDCGEGKVANKMNVCV